MPFIFHGTKSVFKSWRSLEKYGQLDNWAQDDFSFQNVILTLTATRNYGEAVVHQRWCGRCWVWWSKRRSKVCGRQDSPEIKIELPPPGIPSLPAQPFTDANIRLILFACTTSLNVYHTPWLVITGLFEEKGKYSVFPSSVRAISFLSTTSHDSGFMLPFPAQPFNSR